MEAGVNPARSRHCNRVRSFTGSHCPAPCQGTGRRERQARKTSPSRKPGDLLELHTELSDRERKVFIVNPESIFVPDYGDVLFHFSNRNRRAFLCSGLIDLNQEGAQ